MTMKLLHGLICSLVTLAFVRYSWKPKVKLQNRISPERIAGRLRTSARFDPDKMSGKELFRMGQMWRTGDVGMGVDVNRALFFYNKALEKGYTQAYVDLGLLHQEAKRDALTALECFVQAVSTGHLQAIFHLGRLYELGLWPHFKASQGIAINLYELCLAHDVSRQDAMIRLSDIRVGWRGNFGNEDALPWSRDLPADILDRLRPILPAEPELPEHIPLPVPQVMQRRNPGLGPDEEWAWQIPFFDLVQIDAVIGDAVFAGPDHGRVGDSQNVHDTAVLGETKTALQNIRQHQRQNEDPDTAIQKVLRMITSSTAVDGAGKERARSVLNSLTDQVHSKLGMSDKEVLNTVLNRINDPVNAEGKDNLADMLIQNLADGVEHGTAVCSTGRAVRIASTLDALDAEDVLKIRPTWAINEEIGDSVSVVKSAVLADLDDASKQAFEKADPNEEETRVSDQVSQMIKQKLQEKCHKDYVDSGILSEKSLQTRLQPYLDAIE